jgi:arsenate reductase (glutaredoxin)
MNITVYGIPNCDTVTKARKWLDGQGLRYSFQDYKKAGADADRLKSWCAAEGWETILNRGGTTFKKLDPSIKDNVNEATAISLMIAQPSMIKRPVVEYDGGILVGFKASDWEIIFG